MTVSSFNKEVEGIDNVTLSLPTLIGGEGNLRNTADFNKCSRKIATKK